ncbi:hypothetical protein [Aminipila luticellarii]|uniref:IS66 family insertion sequence element accessory protein TnpB n=1 Tax=Aminipila luticellarii TaxID=2507160 RepID=A0A410PUW4_9FIRM|nr:hypothetical protein [Aminipila luticellarii]QAT42741.1 IS66 family insertion sequence hypothetical protein [Aminipila luticellarii]
MESKESQVATQVRLNQWALEVKDCLNRPKNMTVAEWCEQHNMKRANYYWRLKRVRQAFWEQVETPAGNFVELPTPVPYAIPLAPVQATANDNSSTSAVLRTSSGISIEIRQCASAEFMKNLIGALDHA